MLTEVQYRQKYRRIDFYKPNKKQLAFHNLTTAEIALRAGNQLGKTTAAAAQMTFDATASYPAWYQGRKFLTKPPIERSHAFIGWAGCTTSTTTRDGAQLKMLGDVSQANSLGTGMIPLDSIIGKPTMSRGISNFVDTVTVRRETGGDGVIRLKTFEMDRKAWQGEAVDAVWIDEDPGDDVIWGECLARLTATKGRIFWTATPVLGRTPIRKRFISGGPDIAEVVMGLADAEHISEDDKAIVLARYKASERNTRAYGADMAGEGAVFEFPEAEISHSRDPATFPTFWPWAWSVDFSHAGLSASAHPFAAVLGCWDRDTDTIYVVHAIRLRQALPVTHVAAIKEHPCWDAPVLWPHDGARVEDLSTGATFSATYRRLGLNMRHEHTTFKDGGYSFEAGIADMEQRFATGRLKVAKHLSEWFDEYRNYHRVNGLVMKADDDLMSATRGLCMGIRFARVLDPNRGAIVGAYRGNDGSFRRIGQQQRALGVDDADSYWGI
jgi:phage terminase large subunit-like protein